MADLKVAARVHAVSAALAAAAPGVAHDPAALRRQAEACVAADCHSFGSFAEWALRAPREPSGVRLDALPLSTLAEVDARRRARPDAAAAAPPPRSPAAAHVVSFDALSRARTTLDDFTSFYLPLHGLARDAFFRFLPVLTYTEACIYQMDEENEAHTRRLVDAPASTSSPAWNETATGVALRGVLGALGLLSARVLDELAAGATYWAYERRLCAAMAACAPVELDDVYACSSLKSFDYRVLHALVCELAHATASEALLAFLRVDECLTDTADDLFDYEKDLRKNSFNVLRGTVHAVGAHGAPIELASRIGRLEKQHEELLQALPAMQREAYCASRRDAMARPGSEKWAFPPVVPPQQEAARRAAWADADADSEVESDAEPVQPARAGACVSKRPRDGVDDDDGRGARLRAAAVEDVDQEATTV